MSPIDDELRRTLTERAAAVPPGADPIAGIEFRARRMRRQRQAIGAACAVLAVGSAAVVVPLLSRNTSPTPAPVLSATPRPSTSATHAPTSTQASSPPASPRAAGPTSASASPIGQAVGVYFLGDTGTRTVLYREFRKSAAPDRIRAGVELMLQGPLDPDYLTLWPAGTAVRGVTVDGEIATVDLSAEALTTSGGSAAACQSLQQLVWTVTAANTAVRRVAVAVEGRSEGVVSQWWGVGCGPDAPMARHSPSYELLAPVQISTFNEGDAVRSRFSFGGEATVFEGSVSWSVTNAAGTELAAGNSQASEGGPGRGLWQAIVVLENVKSGDVVQLRAWEASAEDGRITNLETKDVTISR